MWCSCKYKKHFIQTSPLPLFSLSVPEYETVILQSFISCWLEFILQPNPSDMFHNFNINQIHKYFRLHIYECLDRCSLAWGFSTFGIITVLTFFHFSGSATFHYQMNCFSHPLAIHCLLDVMKMPRIPSITALGLAVFALYCPPPRASVTPTSCSRCDLSFHRSSTYYFLLFGSHNSSNSSIVSSSFTLCLSLVLLRPLHAKKCVSVSSVSWSHSGHTAIPPWNLHLQFNFNVFVLHLNKITELMLFDNTFFLFSSLLHIFSRFPFLPTPPTNKPLDLFSHSLLYTTPCSLFWLSAYTPPPAQPIHSSSISQLSVNYYLNSSGNSTFSIYF